MFFSLVLIYFFVFDAYLFSYDSKLIFGDEKVLFDDDLQLPNENLIDDFDENVFDKDFKKSNSLKRIYNIDISDYNLKRMFDFFSITPELSDEDISNNISDRKNHYFNLIKTSKNLKNKTFKDKKNFKTVNGLSIISIRIGQDRKYSEYVSRSKKLPIMLTVKSSPSYLKSKLKFKAFNKKSKKFYLIYFLDLFKLNYMWAQDQFLWDGSYFFDKKIKKRLPLGKYEIFVYLDILDNNSGKVLKKIVRKWGYNFKGYYIFVR